MYLSKFDIVHWSTQIFKMEGLFIQYSFMKNKNILINYWRIINSIFVVCWHCNWRKEKNNKNILTEYVDKDTHSKDLAYLLVCILIRCTTIVLLKMSRFTYLFVLPSNCIIIIFLRLVACKQNDHLINIFIETWIAYT